MKFNFKLFLFLIFPPSHLFHKFQLQNTFAIVSLLSFLYMDVPSELNLFYMCCCTAATIFNLALQLNIYLFIKIYEFVHFKNNFNLATSKWLPRECVCMCVSVYVCALQFV